jgi:O-antigen/teichoic acid export membrane protein
MPAANVEDPTHEVKQRASFFRQSGWLMIANIAGGMFMWAVHLLNRFIPPGEYGDFGVFLAVAMLVPTIPLQMVLAQQTARALATDRQAQLAGLMRWTWLVTTVLWAVAAAVVVAFQRSILERWHMSNSTGLWVTMAIVLLSLWMPLFMGALQGKQNFLWLGWTMMSNAIGRITLAGFAVLALHAYASGMITGVLFGMMVATVLGAWHSRDLWLARSEAFDWRGVLRQIVPLFLGFLGFQMLFTADTIFVKGYFSKVEGDYYVSAGTLSRALMWLVLPLASVMFPRIVHSAAKSEKSNLVNLVLFGTAVLAVVGAGVLALLGPWVVRVIYPNQDGQIVNSLLSWYAAAMVPLAVANVLLNNLLARPASKLIPSLCILAVGIGYLYALTRFHDTMVMVLQTMGAGNLLLLVVCAWFTWSGRSRDAAVGSTGPEPA